MSEGWSAIAADNLAAAGELARHHRYRSAANRAYFAAFAAVALRLSEAGVTFPTNREAPPHGDALRKLVKMHLQGFGFSTTSDVRRLIKSLYALRINADYFPTVEVGQREAAEAVIQAQVVLKVLGVEV